MPATENSADGEARAALRVQMMQMATGFFLARAIHAAAELGIADLLNGGPRSVEELAQASGAHANSLYRLLRMLAAQGIFAEDENRRFQLTPLAATLRTDVPGSLRDFVRMMDDSWWQASGRILYTIRTGKVAFDHIYGMQFFDYLAQNAEANQRFDAGMANASVSEDVAVAGSYDFGQFRRVVDVGGGRGGLIAEILKAHPTVSGVLFDQDQVAAEPTKVRAAGVTGRCEVRTGSFFESVPEGADVYVLKKILHDWDDERAVSILRRCRDALAEGGRVLSVDAVIPPLNEPHPGKEVDVLMMVFHGGGERTEAGFRDLYRQAGLKLTKVVATPTMLSIVEGERA